MIIMKENGRATVPGVGNLAIPSLAARELDMDQPAEPHGIGNIGNALGLPGIDTRLKSLLDGDNAHTIKSRSGHYDMIASVAIDPLGGALAKARKIAQDTDLKDEIRVKRVAEAVEEVWPETERRLEAIHESLSKAVNFAEAVYREAWTLSEDTDLNLQELRDREVRDVLRDMEINKRLGVIMDAAKGGQLDMFRVLGADPTGQLAASLPGDTLERAKALALESAGLGWVQVMRDDAQADQEHVSTMIQLFKDGVVADMRRTFGARVNQNSNNAYKEAA